MEKPTVENINEKLSPEAASFLNLQCFDEASSTNEEIKRAIENQQPEGTAIIALEQGGGYGRQGRSWISPLGGLYVSLLFRPLERGKALSEIPTLGLVLSLAVRRTLIKFNAALPVKVKWPNDVICDAGKLCGISLEAIDGALCAGIGLNLFRPITEHPLEGKYVPAYAISIIQEKNLPETVGSEGLTASQTSFYEDISAAFLIEVVYLYNRWLAEGFPSFQDEYRAHASLQGQTVQLVSQTNGILYEGVVQNVDADGHLCLLDAKGEIIHAHSGEVHLV